MAGHHRPPPVLSQAVLALSCSIKRLQSKNRCPISILAHYRKVAAQMHLNDPRTAGAILIRRAWPGYQHQLIAATIEFRQPVINRQRQGHPVNLLPNDSLDIHRTLRLYLLVLRTRHAGVQKGV